MHIKNVCVRYYTCSYVCERLYVCIMCPSATFFSLFSFLVSNRLTNSLYTYYFTAGKPEKGKNLIFSEGFFFLSPFFLDNTIINRGYMYVRRRRAFIKTGAIQYIAILLL